MGIRSERVPRALLLEQSSAAWRASSPRELYLQLEAQWCDILSRPACFGLGSVSCFHLLGLATAVPSKGGTGL